MRLVLPDLKDLQVKPAPLVLRDLPVKLDLLVPKVLPEAY